MTNELTQQLREVFTPLSPEGRKALLKEIVQIERSTRPPRTFTPEHRAALSAAQRRARDAGRHAKARLTSEVVAEIRAEWARDHRWGRQIQLAKQFSVTAATVGRITRGMAWQEAA